MADDPGVKTGAGVEKAAEAAKASGGGDVAGKVASVAGTAVGAAGSGFGLAMGAALGSPELMATGAAGLVGAGGSIVGEVAGGAAGETAAKVGGAVSSAAAVGSSAMAMAGAARSGSGAEAALAATGMAGGAAGLTGSVAGGAAGSVASKVGNMAALAGKAVAVGALAKSFVDARRAVPASVPAPATAATSASVAAAAAPTPSAAAGGGVPAAAGGGSGSPAVSRGLPAGLSEPPAVPATKDPDAPLFTIGCKAVPASARVVSLRGSEAMSRPYAFEVHLQIEKPLSAKPFLEMKEVVNERATLTFFDLEERERGKIHGQIAAIELLEGLQDDLLYRAVLVPKLASLGRNRRSCVYVGKTFPEILHEVLDQLNGWKEGEDYQFVLDGTYLPLDHVCQYRESDLYFLTRLMEQEGVYYFFEQGEEREKVVIIDHMKRHTTLARTRDGKPGPAPKLYSPRSPTDRNVEESFWAFREKHTGGAGVAVSGYDYLNPLAPVESEAAGDDGPTLSFPDENVKTSEQAKHQATIRQEERVRVGKTTCESGSDIGSSVNWTRPVR